MEQVQFSIVENKLPSWLRRLSVISFIVGSLLLLGCETGVYHTVRPGQTLYRISKTYGINEAYLARVNRVQDPAQLKAGARLYIPGAERVRHVSVVKPVQKSL